MFGVNLFLGYLAMLVAMTYSAELFLCLLFGMILGHGLFNSGGPIGETVDPCCAGSQGADHVKAVAKIENASTTPTTNSCETKNNSSDKKENSCP